MPPKKTGLKRKREPSLTLSPVLEPENEEEESEEEESEEEEEKEEEKEEGNEEGNEEGEESSSDDGSRSLCGESSSDESKKDEIVVENAPENAMHCYWAHKDWRRCYVHGVIFSESVV
ncbi:predicted protein [Arabidopsis lyrata subsp. lyrata]|uniref:Predicted protein n=1 Tax=Arabidopsis lyrata subsp. lyrata TaxID=81972 RepID=D7MPE9_ARALL|nr:predicted protein [Arabidopsis lyrata subsp. lyrata]